MMDFLIDLFSSPVPAANREEVRRLIDELIKIGLKDDFLSERPGAGFNTQCRHIRAREIGIRLEQIGGVEVMTYVSKRIRRKIGKTLAAHMDYAWADVGAWVP